MKHLLYLHFEMPQANITKSEKSSTQLGVICHPGLYAGVLGDSTFNIYNMTSKKHTVHFEDEIPNYRPFSMYAILTCGIIIFIIGLYLSINDQIAYGISQPNKYGQGGGKQVIVNGPFTILFGIVISIFPTYQLIKLSKKVKQRHNDRDKR